MQGYEWGTTLAVLEDKPYLCIVQYSFAKSQQVLFMVLQYGRSSTSSDANDKNCFTRVQVNERRDDEHSKAATIR